MLQIPADYAQLTVVLTARGAACTII